MGDHTRSPQDTPREDAGDTRQRPLDPYVAFVGAFLRQVITDALSTPKGTGDWTEGVQDGVRREAQEFLLDLNRLTPWIELTGADVDKIQGRLFRAAELARSSQG